MLLDELQEHISERYFSHYINPNLLAAIYSATGRKMAPAGQPSDSMTYDDGGNDDDNPKRRAHDDSYGDRRQASRGQMGKNHMYAEEIDDNLDYGPVDD